MAAFNKNLFSREFARIALSLLLWTLVITLLISATMAVYPTFIKNQSKVLGMLSIIPKEMLQFKGISNVEDMLSPFGFYSINNIIYMMVLGSIFAIVISANMLMKEEYGRTAEYLLTRPVSRTGIFVSKMSVVLIAVVLLNIVTAVAGYFSMLAVGSGTLPINPFLILSVYTLLLNLLFAATGLFISVVIKRARPVTTFCIGLVLVFYFIYTISKITESVSVIGYLSPYKFANVNALDPSYHLGLWHVAYFLGISVVLTFVSYRMYLRKDIYL